MWSRRGIHDDTKKIAMSMDQDRKFFRTFGMVLGVLVASAIAFVFVARALTPDIATFEALKAERVAERTEPVYAVVTDPNQVREASQAKAGASGDSAAKSPEQVYKAVCSACHGTGVLGAPKFGNAASWKPHIAKGKAVLYKHAIHGFKAMPPKGGAVNLSDAEVKAAVDYMVHQSGGY